LSVEVVSATKSGANSSIWIWKAVELLTLFSNSAVPLAVKLLPEATVVLPFRALYPGTGLNRSGVPLW